MKKLVFVMMSAAAFAFALPALADEHAGTGDKMMEDHKGMMMDHHKDMMKMMDTNNDGKVSKAEFSAFHEKKFNEMDTNHDGSMDADEMRKGKRAMHEKMREHRKGKCAEDAADKAAEPAKK
jgi:Ca2+-binding EF-hand superfamily protein